MKNNLSLIAMWLSASLLVAVMLLVAFDASAIKEQYNALISENNITVVQLDDSNMTKKESGVIDSITSDLTKDEIQVLSLDKNKTLSEGVSNE